MEFLHEFEMDKNRFKELFVQKHVDNHNLFWIIADAMDWLERKCRWDEMLIDMAGDFGTEFSNNQS
ncbi:unnamed protein product [Citrullus colocynthis]|uniref:Uncharacterized protein n=1 Tax=Citrullus colocynthis TaxID=252529 RepID=A0ABP0Z2H1_9ROSI